jgi:hypothetical protein
MITLRTWNTITPIYITGVPHSYSDESLLGEIDPKSNRMRVTKRQPGPGDLNVPTWVPMTNVACYTTLEEYEAAFAARTARDSAPSEQPSA